MNISSGNWRYFNLKSVWFIDYENMCCKGEDEIEECCID